MNKEELIINLKSLGFSLDNQKIENIEDIIEKTLVTNGKFNLTAITDKEVFREKMVYDSALGIVDVDLKDKKVIDVGTGAGFPGMIIYILKPEVDITLLDSTAKKINYLEEYSKERGFRISFAISRMEEYARKHVEKYDFAFARAVSSLNILLELIAPVLKVGGEFIALKGANAELEIKEANSALKKLGLVIKDIKKYILPESREERNIIYIKKIKPTPNKYPRLYKDIKARPL